YSILQQSIDSGFMVFYIEVSVREDCVLKAARAYMVFDVLERNGEVVKSTPSVQEIEQEKFDRSFSVYYISNVEQAVLEKEILQVSEIDSAVIISVDSESLSEMTQTKAQIEVAASVQEIAATAP